MRKIMGAKAGASAMAAGALAVVVVLGLAGCSSGPDYTAKGTVAGKDKEYECSKKKAAGRAGAVPVQAVLVGKSGGSSGGSTSGGSKVTTSKTGGTSSGTGTKTTPKTGSDVDNPAPVLPPVGTQGNVQKSTPKSTATAKSKCAWDYDVQVKQADGSTVEEDVTEEHYGRCEVGEAFPGCTRG